MSVTEIATQASSTYIPGPPPSTAAPHAKSISNALTVSDLESLSKSYITPELAERAGLRRVDHREGSNLLWRNNEAEDNAGIVFPYIWPGESEVTTYRIRRDHPPQKLTSDGSWKDDGKYLSQAGVGGILYVGPGITYEILWDKKMPVVITEGEKKCLALHRVAEEKGTKGKPLFLALGLPGVYNFLSKQRVKDESG